MSEKYQPPSPENNFQGRLSEGMLAMMNFEATILGYHLPTDEHEFDRVDSLVFGQKIEEHRELFDALFTDPGFHPAAASTNLAPLVRLCLLTGPQIIIHDMQSRADGAFFRKEFSTYNRAMRDAIRANPDMTKEGLTYVLQGAALWAKVPTSYHYESMQMFDRVTKGAIGEIVAEQLLNSATAQRAGVSHKEASIKNDIGGFDRTATLSDGRELTLDVKYSPWRIRDPRSTADLGQVWYEILSGNNVRIYTGTGDVLSEDRLRLSDECIEPKAAMFVEALHNIADTIDIRNGKLAPTYSSQLAAE